MNYDQLLPLAAFLGLRTRYWIIIIVVIVILVAVAYFVRGRGRAY